MKSFQDIESRTVFRFQIGSAKRARSRVWAPIVLFRSRLSAVYSHRKLGPLNPRAMKTRTVSTLLATLLLLTSVLLQTAFAAQPSQPMHLQEKHSPSTEFHSYLLQTLPKDLASVASVSFHYPLNAGLESLEKEASIQSALAQAGRFSLFDLAKDASHLQPVKTANVDDVLRKRTPTLVIFPGIFAEFIRVRAFEEVFAAPSVAQKQFQASLQAAQAKPQLAQLLRDPSFNSASMKAEDVPLSQLIEVASIDDAKGNVLTGFFKRFALRSRQARLGSRRPFGPFARSRKSSIFSVA